MENILAGHTNSYHTYTFDDALEGIAKAGFKYVELSAVRGWTEHVPLEASEADIREIKAKLTHWGLTPSALSGHSDLTTAAGLVDGKKAIDLTEKFGLTIMNTAVGGHYSEDEDKGAFMDHIHDLADYAAQRGIVLPPAQQSAATDLSPYLAASDDPGGLAVVFQTAIAPEEL